MEKQKITDAEKKKWKAMDLQELILWHNRFIRIIEGILEEHEWQRLSASQDLPDHEAEKYAELYGEHKEKFLYYKERARYLGELLQLDPDADLIKYSPEISYMKPTDFEQTEYEKITTEQLSEYCLKFMRIIQGIDEIIDYYQSDEYIKDFDRKLKRTIKKSIPVFTEYRSYFSERFKLVVEIIEDRNPDKKLIP